MFILKFADELKIEIIEATQHVLEVITLEK